MRALKPPIIATLIVLGGGCLAQPRKNYTPEQIPEITELAEVMRVQASHADPLFKIRDQESFSDEEFARMAKAAEILQATGDHLAKTFAGKGNFDDGFAKFAKEQAEHAKQLEEATSSNNAGPASQALEAIKKTCAACHGVYR